jgi:hypothetical protein
MAPGVMAPGVMATGVMARLHHAAFASSRSHVRYLGEDHLIPFCLSS